MARRWRLHNAVVWKCRCFKRFFSDIEVFWFLSTLTRWKRKLKQLEKLQTVQSPRHHLIGKITQSINLQNRTISESRKRKYIFPSPSFLFQLVETTLENERERERERELVKRWRIALKYNKLTEFIALTVMSKKSYHFWLKKPKHIFSLNHISFDFERLH